MEQFKTFTGAPLKKTAMVINPVYQSYIEKAVRESRINTQIAQQKAREIILDSNCR
ncbi:MAG: hypothetical protein MJ156_02345 [Alphaproteobacteria bacterium]|nr:hypothetical protein [Alphaproteobacteria bacterium]